jgi:hypothetical protein
MSVNTFDTIISDSQREKARERYGHLANSQEGQIEILKAASKGTPLAAIFLYDRLQKVIAKAFWKYHMGPNKSTHHNRIKAGAAKDFVSLAFELLMDGKRSPSPYTTFDPSKFSPQSDLIKQFAYYLYRYLQNESVKQYGSEQTPAGETTIGYDQAGIEDEQSVASHSEDIDERETQRAFYNYVKQQDAKSAQILKLAMRGMEASEIAKELNMSQMGVRNIIIKKLKVYWEEFNK